jgi:hypothetical protein
VELRFSGVFQGNDRETFVLYGDDMYGVGEKIDEVKFLEISMKKIIVKYKGNVYDIPM